MGALSCLVLLWAHLHTVREKSILKTVQVMLKFACSITVRYFLASWGILGWMLKAAIVHTAHLREAEPRSQMSPWCLGTYKGRFCYFFNTVWDATEAFHLIWRLSNAASNMGPQYKHPTCTWQRIWAGAYHFKSKIFWICIKWEITQEGRALTSGKEKTEDKHNKLLFEIQRATVELLL